MDYDPSIKVQTQRRKLCRRFFPQNLCREVIELSKIAAPVVSVRQNIEQLIYRIQCMFSIVYIYARMYDGIACYSLHNIRMMITRNTKYI